MLTICLREIETYAVKVFTRNIFKEIKSKIKDTGALNVIEREKSGDIILFKTNRFCSLKSKYQVRYDKSKGEFMCDCRLFKTRGIPCSHIFCVMKHDHLHCIPSSLIRKKRQSTIIYAQFQLRRLIKKKQLYSALVHWF